MTNPFDQIIDIENKDSSKGKGDTPERSSSSNKKQFYLYWKPPESAGKFCYQS